MCESPDEDRMIIPPAEALTIVGGAGKVYLRTCVCRAQEQLCPPDTWEVCLLFESAPPDKIREARPITTEEALTILKTTAEQRAIYNLFYTHSDRRVTELCSCCACCCHPLYRMQKEGNYREQIRSEYVAVTDSALCVGCGACEESCFFGARRIENGRLHLVDERCFGCGKCIDSCPENAIGLERQVGRGLPIPIAV